MKYHGNYCGPNWSAGKHQPSVVSDVPPVDEFDATCKEHDAAYARKANLKEADYKFAKTNLKSLDPKRMIAGALVGLQGLSRSADKPISKHKHPKQKKKTRSIMATYHEYPTIARPPSIPTMVRVKRKNNKKPKPVIGIQIPRSSTTLPATYTLNEKLKPGKVSGNGSITTLTHKGLIGPVFGNTTFGATKNQCNVGRAQMFPWASKLARSYDKYRFLALKFTYRPVVPTTRAGVVMMSFDYDTLDDIPVTKVEHAQTFPNIETNSFMPSELKVKCDSVWRFVRQGEITGADYKTYDFGQLVVSSCYDTTTAICGEVYVEYTVQLDKPSVGDAISMLVYATTSITKSSPLGSVPILSGSSQPFEKVNNDTLKCTIAGEYSINEGVLGTGITAILIPLLTTTINGAIAQSGVAPGIAAAGGASAVWTWRVRCGVGDLLNFSDRFTASTLTQFTLVITEGDYSNI